ncbi:MAG: preprotein translocase subunit SecG [Deltaproteobacteria bacterium]|nr:preprotein translocase subunit SecG [Deltaproteobacteria bacterium]NIS77865.1 preprotein translocase subunit SecG [Deltaproteobacteria bacterium]
MYTFLIVVHVIVSIVLIAVVLMQTGKGAELGAVFGGSSSQTIFGPAGPAGALGKITAGAAIIFMLTSLILAYMSGSAPKKTLMEDVPAQTETAPPVSVPPLPQSLPGPVEAPAPPPSK